MRLIIGLLLILFVPSVTHAQFDIPPGSTIDSLVTSHVSKIRPENLRATVSLLESYENRVSHENQWHAARWIARELKDTGYETEVQTYQYEGEIWPNIVARLVGDDRDAPVYVCIAHIDSTSDNPHDVAPGADDDGTGVAVLLESARALTKLKPRHSIYFVFFSNEEYGRAGSKSFARKARKEGLEIAAVINFDVLGYSRPESFNHLDAIQAHHKLKYKIKALYRLCRNYLAGLHNEKRAIHIVGRNPDASIVDRLSTLFTRYGATAVQPIVDDDCG